MTTRNNMPDIKDEFKSLQVGYNNSGLPLGIREDLDLLAQMALDSGDAYLLNLFKVRPTEQMVREHRGQQFLDKQ